MYLFRIIKYPFNQVSDSVVITTDDLQCLGDGEFLNDNIISFYLKYLTNEVLNDQDKKRTHIFDTFFYQRLTQRTTFKKSKEEANLR